MPRSRTVARLAVVIAAIVLASVAGWSVGRGHNLGSIVDRVKYARLRSPLGGTGSHRANIVFVLTDDLSQNLVQYLPHVLALERSGTTFTNYTVSDSLCCPSRSSIFTGRFPHNTGVFTNGGHDGGFRLFYRRHEESNTFATALQSAGYRTALMGKYLNGYLPAAIYGKDGNLLPNDQNGLHLNWVRRDGRVGTWPGRAMSSTAIP